MKHPKTITDAELSVLKFLWEHEAASAKEITSGLYPRSSTADLGTVHSLLQRLESKKFVRRDRSAHAHTFSAAVSQTEMAGHQLQEMADKLADGSLAPFLTHLVEADRLTEQDLAELRTLLKRRKSKE